MRSVVWCSPILFTLGIIAGCLPDREPTAPIPIDRPLSRAIQPAPGTLIVPVKTSVTMTFNQPMDAGTFAGHFSLRDLAGNSVAGGFAPAETTVAFLPSQSLTPATVYQAVLRGRIRNALEMSIQVNNEPVYDDTTVLMSTWFYTEGDYSKNGFFHTYVRDRKEGKVRVFTHLDSEMTSIGGFSAPEGMVLTPDGLHLFVSSTGRDSVYSINTQTNSVEAGFSVAAYPSSMTASGNSVYVISINGKMLTKINSSSLTVERQTSLSFYPARLAISPDGATLYTIDQSTRDLVLIRESDGATIKRLANAVTQLVAGDLVVEQSTGNVYMCNAQGLNIRVADGAGTSFQTLQSFASGSGPVSIAFSPTVTGEYYVAAGKAVMKFATGTTTAQNSVTFSSGVKSVTVVPSGEVLYATYNMSVVVIDARTFSILREVQLTSSGIESVVSSSKKY